MADTEEYQGQPIILFDSTEAWEVWLEAQPADSSGLWLKLAKKGCAT